MDCDASGLRLYLCGFVQAQSEEEINKLGRTLGSTYPAVSESSKAQSRRGKVSSGQEVE